jgi:hypothetical protein
MRATRHCGRHHDTYHKGPISTYGITDAFRDAELLTEAIDEGLSRHRALEESLAQDKRWRHDVSLPFFGLTCEFATLQPPSPEQRQLFAALHHDQEQTNRFFGAMVGTVRMPEFFTPENIGRIMGDSISANRWLFHGSVPRPTGLEFHSPRGKCDQPES